MEEKERHSLMKKVPSAVFLHKQPVDVNASLCLIGYKITLTASRRKLNGFQIPGSQMYFSPINLTF